MKSSFCIDLQRFMLIPTKFPLSRLVASNIIFAVLGIGADAISTCGNSQ